MIVKNRLAFISALELWYQTSYQQVHSVRTRFVPLQGISPMRVDRHAREQDGERGMRGCGESGGAARLRGSELRRRPWARL